MFFQGRMAANSGCGILQTLQKIISAIGLNPNEYSCKELRHTTGTLMHKKGVPWTICDAAQAQQHQDDE